MSWLGGWVGSAVNGSHRMSIEKLESWKCQGDQWGTMGNNGEHGIYTILEHVCPFFGEVSAGEMFSPLAWRGFFPCKKSVLLKESHGPCVY